MDATLRKILDMSLQEKSREEILKEIAHTEKNIEWIRQIESILSAIGDVDFENPPEKCEIDGKESWIGGVFDAARDPNLISWLIPPFSRFRHPVKEEIAEIIANSEWSSRYSFMRWKKDPASVDPYIRELFENA